VGHFANHRDSQRRFAPTLPRFTGFNAPLHRNTQLASELIETDAPVLERAQILQSAGYGAFDALHLSSAESGRADVLLTTDDKFVRRAARGDGDPRVPVRNPLSWLEEVNE
jgi:hypothetical protein